MPDDKLYTSKLNDPNLKTPDGFPLSEETGPTSEAGIVQSLRRHYLTPYFEEQEDGRILIFRSKKEASDEVNAVGEVTAVK